MTHFPSAEYITEHLHRMIVGDAASTLQSNKVIQAPGTFYVLPSWVSLPPTIDVGKKQKKNKDIELSHRINWSCGPIAFLPKSLKEQRVTWEITSLGAKLSNEVALSETNSKFKISTTQTINCTEIHRCITTHQIHSVLDRLIHEGGDAKWELIQSLEPYALVQLQKANWSFSRSLAEFHHEPNRPFLSETDLQVILTDFTYSAPDRQSPLERILVGACAPHVLDTHDLIRHLTFNIWSKANSEVQRATGDPHIGPKIRKLYAQIQPTTVRSFLATYRKLYPSDALSYRRALAALSRRPISVVSRDAQKDRLR